MSRLSAIASFASISLLLACSSSSSTTTADVGADGAGDAVSEVASDAADAADAAEVWVNPPECATVSRDTCLPEQESLECVFGDRCKRACVCERGTWACLGDSCESTCPTTPPTGACDTAEIDRRCYLQDHCTWCFCEATEGGAAWSCQSGC